jgi:RNA polymerase sigma-70 factor (ECF subfamily)
VLTLQKGENQSFGTLIMTESDQALLDSLRTGSDEAFEQLFLRYYSQVYRVLYSLLGSREASEDLAQETFLELYRHVPTLQGDGALAAWLCRVGLNKGYNLLRGERRAQQMLQRFMVGREEYYDDTAQSEERAFIRDVLARLPERQSKLLLLRHAGLSLAEIAPVLEVAPSSVGTLLARAEKAFAGAYELMRRVEKQNPSGKRET